MESCIPRVLPRISRLNMPTRSQPARLIQCYLIAFYLFYLLSDSKEHNHTVVCYMKWKWVRRLSIYLSSATGVNQLPNTLCYMFSKYWSCYLTRAKGKMIFIGIVLPYISLLSNNPSHNPFIEPAVTDIKVSMISQGIVWILTDSKKQLSCCFCSVWSILVGATNVISPPCIGPDNLSPCSLQ